MLAPGGGEPDPQTPAKRRPAGAGTHPLAAGRRARGGRDRRPRAGVKESDASRIFEPFFSTKDSTGLGLSICHSIVRQHEGELTGRRARGWRGAVPDDAAAQEAGERARTGGVRRAACSWSRTRPMCGTPRKRCSARRGSTGRPLRGGGGGARGQGAGRLVLSASAHARTRTAGEILRRLQASRPRFRSSSSPATATSPPPRMPEGGRQRLRAEAATRRPRGRRAAGPRSTLARREVRYLARRLAPAAEPVGAAGVAQGHGHGGRRRAHRRHGAPDRRVRNGQGAARPAPHRLTRAPRPLRARQLRGDPLELWRASSSHRKDRSPRRRDREGRSISRTAAPCSSTRWADARCGPAKLLRAIQDASSTGWATRQPTRVTCASWASTTATWKPRSSRTLPGRPVLPANVRTDRRAAAARAEGRHRRTLARLAAAEVAARLAGRRPRSLRDARRLRAYPGPATCVSCARDRAGADPRSPRMPSRLDLLPAPAPRRRRPESSATTGELKPAEALTRLEREMLLEASAGRAGCARRRPACSVSTAEPGLLPAQARPGDGAEEG